MLRNYFIIAMRSLWKNKAFSAINIMGLAIGISASLVIYLLVQYDLSFDKFHKEGERIYRVVCKFNFSGETFYNSGVTYPLAKAVREEVTGLDNVVPINIWDSDLKLSVIDGIDSKPRIFRKQKQVAFVDQQYFHLIEYKWLAGSPATSLKQPYQVVLTEANARLYFPQLKPKELIGKQLVFDDTIQMAVSGVVADLKRNTDFTAQTFISSSTQELTNLKPQEFTNWENTTSAALLMIKLSKGATPLEIQRKLSALYVKYIPAGENGKKAESPFLLQPLSAMHFDANYGALFDNRTAHKPTMYGLVLVASFLLILACINFINLTTAQASKRAKEIGIRKTMGSSKKDLVIQFLGETFLVTSIATILSAALAPVLLKAFSEFIPEGLRFSVSEQPGLIVFVLLLIIVVSVLSGFYPAMILAGYKPVTALKNQAYKNTGTTRSVWVRKTLTASQFIIAQVFIMASLLVSKQINYTLNKDLGFKKDAIIHFQTNFYDTLKTRKYVLLNKLKSIPGIDEISLSNNPIAATGTWSSSIKYKDGTKEIETNVQMKMADTNYLGLYDLKLIAGKNITASDSIKEFVINETYARILGFNQPQHAIGKYLEWNGQPKPIAGVVADFHQQSLHSSIKPLAIGSRPELQRTFNIALSAANKREWKNTIKNIEQSFRQVYPDDDFEYRFQDETVRSYYENERKISSLLKWATGLTIFISCLGLLGLVIYTTAQRTKEIGVRKVLGASVAQIVSLISKDFMLIVLFAFVIAVPLASIGIHKWLEDFSYRTPVNWWDFFLAGVIMLLVAVFTLSIQTIKAAMMNPVKSLRTE